jgi:hypothetical protein
MLYDILALGALLVAIVLLFIAIRILFQRGWFLACLKGMFGFMLFMLSVLSSLMAWDIYRYDEILGKKSIATISFEELELQNYRVSLVDSSGAESQYKLRGDQWQLDARIFTWNEALKKVGFTSGYRLHRLAGRYYSLEKERNAEHTAYDLNSSLAYVDVWQWIRKSAVFIPWLNTVSGSANYVPMSDGALYEVRLSQTGLTAQPLNERAQTAVKRWQ